MRAWASISRNGTGFSLPELLIALTVGAVVGSALISIIRSQSAYYTRQEDAVIAQQNIRAVYDLMGAEVRLASGADLLLAVPDSVAIRSDVSRAVVCDSTGPDEASVFVYDSVSAANLPSGFRGLAISLPMDSTWSYADGGSLTVLDTGNGPRAICAIAGAPSTASDDRYRRLSGFQTAFSRGAPPRGTLLRAYGRLTFSFTSSIGGGPGQSSLRRNSQELAAPFGGAAFSYRLSDGSVAAMPTSGRLPDVVEVLVSGMTFGTAATAPHMRSFNHRLVLRNAIRSP